MGRARQTSSASASPVESSPISSPAVGPTPGPRGSNQDRARRLGTGKRDSARAAFEQARGGAGRPLPHLERLEALFGQDLAEVRVFQASAQAMEALGARAATDGQDILLGPKADEASLMEEVVHVLQARQGGGGGDGTSDPDAPHEVAAGRLARRALAGQPLEPGQAGPLGPGAIHRDPDRGALRYGSAPGPIADANAAQGELDASPEQRAQQLATAIRADDMRTIAALLAGDNQEVKRAYQAFFGQSVELDMIDRLPYGSMSTGLSWARHGRADLQSRIRAVTWDIVGTHEEKLYGILEAASLEERLSMANNSLILFYITRDTSGDVRERCMHLLRPLMGHDGLSAEARQTLFQQIREAEAQLGQQAETLLVRLRARKGWLDDDEDGMVSDVEAWAGQRGPVAELDMAARRPAELMGVMDWLQGELSDRQFLQVVNTVRTGGHRDLLDKVAEAGADTTWGVSDTDEEGIYAAITAASAQERQAILDDPARLARLLAPLDEGSERERARALLRGQGTGDSASAYQELLSELDSWLYISDANIYACLERMSPQELARVRQDTALLGRIERGVSDLPRLHALVGYTGSQGPDQDNGLPAADLAASNERLVARIEHAVDSWDDDEDLVYRSVLEWQAAGGAMDPSADAALLQRARTALGDLDQARRTEIMAALNGSRLLSWRDRLESAGEGLGTDNTGLEATLKDVPEVVLVREWSNLAAYKQQAEAAATESEVQALSGFIVDIDNDTKYLLSEERSDWRDLLGDLRGRLIDALRKPELAGLAEREFHYVPRASLLTRLQYAQARMLSDDDRGPGFWNNVSMGINDTWSPTGVLTENAFATFAGEARDVVTAAEGTEHQQQQVVEADAAYASYLQSHQEYAAARSAAAAIAGAIVGIIASTLITIATAGAAGPACAAFIGSVAGGLLTELTEAAVEGNGYDPEKGAQDLAVASVTALITLGMGQLAEKIADGAAATARVQSINTAIKARFGDTFARYTGAVGSQALESALSTFPSEYATDLIRTEGLLRQELGGAGGAMRRTMQDFGTSIVTKGVQHAVNDRSAVLADLRRRGEWDEYADLLVRQKLINSAIASVASQIASGEAPSAQDAVKFICKLLDARSGARLDARDAQTDVASTLRFFNEADAESLQSVRFIGPATAQRIIQARGAGGFTSLQQLLDIPYFTQRVLSPAASEVRDDFHRRRDEERRRAGEGGGQP